MAWPERRRRGALWLAATMLIGIALAADAPLFLGTKASGRDGALALAAYFMVEAGSAAFGAFPVPLAGYGISFVLGAWLGMGQLLNLHRMRSLA